MMNRVLYYDLRHAARLAERSYAHIAGDTFSTPYDRDRAYQWMLTCERAVPGGLAAGDRERVSLPGWYARRLVVHQRIRERHAAAHTDRVLTLLSR